MLSRQRLIGVFLGCGAVLVAVYFWPFSTKAKVRRLLEENTPMSRDIFYFGRSWTEIQADLDSLGTAAVPGLIDALEHPSGRVRYLAAGQLGRLKDSRGVEPLIAALRDEDTIVRMWSANALGQIGDPQSIPALRKTAADDPDEKVRDAAKDTLATLQKP